VLGWAVSAGGRSRPNRTLRTSSPCTASGRSGRSSRP